MGPGPCESPGGRYRMQIICVMGCKYSRLLMFPQVTLDSFSSSDRELWSWRNQLLLFTLCIKIMLSVWRAGRKGDKMMVQEAERQPIWPRPLYFTKRLQAGEVAISQKADHEVEKLVQPFMYFSFTQQICIKHLLCARNYARLRGLSSNRGTWPPPLWNSPILICL